jgi:hypothetical protein
MHSIKLNVEDNIYNHVMFLLNSLNNKDLQIVEDKLVTEDWSYLESQIDIGLNSGTSEKSHTDILNDIKRKYV